MMWLSAKYGETNVKEVLCFIGICIVILAMLTFCVSADKNAICEWAKDNKCQVVSIDQCIIDCGPFWPDEDARIYKVQLIDYYEKNRTAYFRFWITGLEQAWYP